MAIVDVKKKTDAAPAPPAVQPADGKQKDALKDALKDPLGSPVNTEKTKDQITGDQKKDKEKPAEASIMPAKEPGSTLVVVKQGDDTVVVGVKADRQAEVMAETNPDAVKPEKVEKAVKEAVQPSKPTVDAAKDKDKDAASKAKGVAAKVPV